jgi:uncharacterized membrane protein
MPGMGDEEPQNGPRALRTNRLEALSDGVFAIAVTLLVLDLSIPPGAENLLRAFLDQWPSYLGYVVSFATIGSAWLAHSAITEYLDRADAGLIRLNLLLLMVVSFLPFPTRLLAEYIGEPETERVAATIYGINLIFVAILVWVLWRYAVSQRLVRPDAGDAEVEVLTKRLTPGLAGYMAMIILGLFLPIAAVFGYLAIALFFILPFGLKGRRASRS